MSRSWNTDQEEFDFKFKTTQALFCPCVGDDANKNLSGPQRELLLWHWRTGCSMRRVQQLMVEHEGISSNDESVIFPQVIKPKFKSTSSCPIPLCAACELARAKKRNPGVKKQQAIKERQDILACNQYQAGDFVSMDQYLQMITLKTSVLLGASMKLGAMLGGATDGCAGLLYDVGKSLGFPGAKETFGIRTSKGLDHAASIDHLPINGKVRIVLRQLSKIGQLISLHGFP